MDHAKKAANKGLYALSEDSADSISDLGESKVDWKTPSAPQPQAIGAEDSGATSSTTTADKHSPRTSLAAARAQAKQMNALRSKAAATSLRPKSTVRQTTSRRGEHSKNTALPACGSSNARINPRKHRAPQAMLGKNTAGSTTGTNIPHITHALGQQGQPTSDKQDIKFVTYSAYAAEKIPWEQELIDASTAIDRGRRLAEHATNAADLALGLVTTWAPIRRNETAPTTRNDEKETANTETHRTNERTRENTKEQPTPNRTHACTQTGGTWKEGRCQSTARHAESANAHTDNAHNIQHATRAGMMLAALVVKTPA
ncbi:hypothetical protein ERJ75_001573100 [Trypanosoma vivax]|nr:hypothetical protein ERJ75_001573100 [Trypanosoma vivax]